MAEPDLEFLRRKVNDLQALGGKSSAAPPSLAPAGKPPDMGSMGERLAKLEGAFDWIKVTVALIGAVLIAGITFIGVQITRVDGRISGLSDKVDALPDRVGVNLRDLTSTLSQAILASKQVPPQVILMPAPEPAPPR